MLTDRLELRLPVESDRPRLLELFTNDDFMVFSAGVHTVDSGNRRFDRMLERAAEFDFAKQCVVERSSGEIIGYSGIDWFEFEGVRHLEYGYRLTASSRGKGYMTEASLAIIDLADRTAQAQGGHREVYALIDPRNGPSQNVASKLGFRFWRHAPVDDFPVNLYIRELRARS